VASTIRIDCPSCGAIDVPVGAARLLLDLGSETAGNVVEYTCPRCGQTGHHPVTERGTRLLTAAGITVVYPDAVSRRECGGVETNEGARMPPSWQHPRRSPGAG
jgi:hypothetical protein